MCFFSRLFSVHYKKISFFFIFIILIICFLLRIYNLNYNVPFNDEAIYIVIGRLGLFQGDWQSYNSQAWMGGASFAYPVITAIAYITGGIYGSRLLNVIIGVLIIEYIFFITIYYYSIINTKSIYAGIVAALLLGTASISIYVSRLATYDMPSFFFFFLSLLFLIKTEKQQDYIGKSYFLSSLTFIIAVLFKSIVLIYLPILIIFSYIHVRTLSKEYMYYWKRYFLLPVTVIVFLYLFTSLQTFLSFSSMQIAREKADLIELITFYIKSTIYLWPFWLVGSFGMLITKQWKQWIVLTIFSLWIVLFHFILQRPQTFDKHIFLSIAFLSITAGIGIVDIVDIITKKVYIIGAIIIVTLGMGLYIVYSYQASRSYNNLWKYNPVMLKMLPEYIRTNDKVLVEVGATAILETYNIISPANVTTFDWFSYENLQGKQAYAKAVSDGFFNVIQLGGENDFRELNREEIKVAIEQNIGNNYKLIYHNNESHIYVRVL